MPLQKNAIPTGKVDSLGNPAGIDSPWQKHKPFNKPFHKPFNKPFNKPRPLQRLHL
jgi:hypothetical protein